MNNEQNFSNSSFIQEESSATTLAKEVYHAPQVKIHGKLEKLTLQGASLDATPTPGATEDGNF